MNVLTIAGNIGRDCRVNSVNGQNGAISVCNFVVAVDKRQKDQNGQKQTLWVECALWGARADALAQYLTKGTKVSVSGEADVTSYTDNNGNVVPKMTLRVNDVTLQGGGQQQGQQGGQQGQNQNGGYHQQAAQGHNGGYGQGGGQQQPPAQRQQAQQQGQQQGRQNYQQGQGGQQGGDQFDYDSEIPF